MLTRNYENNVLGFYTLKTEKPMYEFVNNNQNIVNYCPWFPSKYQGKLRDMPFQFSNNKLEGCYEIDIVNM